MEECKPLPVGGGAHRLMKHPFFDTVDWGALAAQRVPPPYPPPKEHGAAGAGAYTRPLFRST